MRIIHVNEQSTVTGGRESHIERFCAMSKALGHESIVTLFPNPMDGAASTIDAPDVILLHTRASWSYAKEWGAIGPTFAWVHDYAFVCPASISYFRNEQVACHLPPGVHCMANAYLKFCNARRPDRNLANYLAVRRTLSGVQHLLGIIVASSYMKERLITSGVAERLVQILPYFVESDTALDEQKDTGAEDPCQILYVGRLSEVKGVEALLDALALLPEKYRLVIAGDGYNRPALQNSLQARKIDSKRVEFAGYITSQARLHKLYTSSAVVVIPSLWPEPFGIVGLEALLHRRPVVAFDVGGISDWLVDGKVGLLARPGDGRDLAAKLLVLLQDRDYRHRLGEQGRDHVQGEFSWRRHWARFADICWGSGAIA